MTHAHAPDPIAALWQAAHAWFAETLAAFGRPAGIATLAREACTALARELAALRSLVLKLLLVEAARLPRPDAPPPRRAQPALLAPACRVDDVARPETWNVRFSLRLPRAAKPRRRASGADAPARRDPHPLELARRCEALRRVLDDPAPFAARLARRLYALGAAACAAARRIALWRPRLIPPNRSMLHARASVCAHDHVACFKDTG